MWDRQAEVFVEGEEDGAPEEDVRLDEVLSEPGDVLRYAYDYGDGWLHTLKLEKVLPGPCTRPRLLAGRHETPTEDSGGIWRWNDDPDLTPLDLEALDDDLVAWAEEHGPA